MDLEEILRLIGRVLLFLCAGISLVFCISYQVVTKGAWKDTVFGRHIMSYSAMFAVFLLIWIVGIALGASNLIYRSLLVAAFAAIPYIQGRQLFLLFRINRNYNGGAKKEGGEITDLPAEVQGLVHAVDQMRDDWSESDDARKQDLWRKVHEANDRVWDRKDV